MHWNRNRNGPRAWWGLFRRHQKHIDRNFEADVEQLQNPDDHRAELRVEAEKAAAIVA